MQSQKITNKIYSLWLKSKFVSKKDKLSISKLSKQKIEQNFIDKKIEFGTAGARGHMGPGTTLINEQTISQITIGYARFLQNQSSKFGTIVIGHDNRRNSKKYSLLVAKIISAHGFKAKIFGLNNRLIPTPIVSYAIRELKALGGVIITASHNPKEYNGYKVYKSDGGQLLPTDTAEISKLMPSISDVLAKKTSKSIWNIRPIPCSIIRRYFSVAKKAIIQTDILNTKLNEPIIFTGHHGTSVKLLPKFLKKLGFNIISVKEQSFYDQDFINSPNSNPENPSSFELGILCAEIHNSKTIIGVDPDADRMCVMIKHCGQWRQITGNEMGIIFTHYLFEKKQKMAKPYLISSFVSNTLVDKIALEYNAKVYRTGTGFKWMGDLITKIGDREQFVIAFEEAIGALVLPINRDKDAFTSSALCLEIIRYYELKKLTLIDVLETIIYKKYGPWFGTTDSFVIKDFNWKEIAEQKMQFLSEYDQGTIGRYKIKSITWNSQGGCLDWILDNDSWIRFRKSGTEPKFKIYYNLQSANLGVLQKDYKTISSFFKKILDF